MMWELCGYVAEVDANEMSVDPKNGNITLRIVGVIYPPFMIQKIPIGSMMTISPTIHVYDQRCREDRRSSGGKRMKIFHHADLDGEASAASLLFSKPFREMGAGSIGVIPANYNIPFPIDTIAVNEEIFILDFCLQESGMWERLLSVTSRVTWIDHHERSIREAPPEASALAGIRAWERDGKPVAACELSWEYFNPTTSIPEAISLMGDFDCWRFTHGDRTRQFVKGVLTVRDTRPASLFWVDAILYEHTENTRVMIEETCRIGELAMRKGELSNAQDLDAWGFEIDVEGLHGICINRLHAGSSFFRSRAAEYEVLTSIAFDGERWTVSLYHGSNKDVDLSEIAAKFGGSGHRGAAGFQCSELPFRVTGRLANR